MIRQVNLDGFLSRVLVYLPYLLGETLHLEYFEKNKGVDIFYEKLVVGKFKLPWNLCNKRRSV